MAKKSKGYATSQDILKSKMIQALIENDFHITNSANHVGIDKRTYFKWMDTDPDFAQKVEHAKLDLIQAIQAQYQKALRNGVENISVTEKEVYNAKGVLVGREKTVTRKRYQAKPSELLSYLERKAPKDWGYDRNQQQNDESDVDFVNED